MTSLTAFFESPDAGQPALLREVRLAPEPATIVFFTDDGEAVSLHYEQSENLRGYVVCPGAGCPICFIGSAPQKVGLLPVYNLESKQIEVLRVPAQIKVGSLWSVIGPLLKRPDIASCVVVLARHGYTYDVTVRPVGAGADIGAAAIARYVEAGADRPQLSSAFAHPTAPELAEVERIRRKLDAIGGYPPASHKP